LSFGVSFLARFSLVAGPMIYMIDASVINVAVPAIARDLDSPLTTVQWTVSGYLLTTAAGLAASAWLARRFGTLRAFGGSMAGFCVASVVCAFAPTALWLIVARIVQGLAGAPLVPLALGLLFGRGGAARQLPASVGVIFFVAPAAGPAIGGLLVSAFGWPSIFLINLPIGLLSVLGLRFGDLPELGVSGSRSARLDLPGLFLLAGALGAGTYGATKGAEQGWFHWSSAPWWSMALPLLAVYALWAHRLRARRREPVVDLTLLTNRQHALSLGLCGAASVILFAIQLLAPVFLQQVQGHSTIAVGLALLPQGIAMGLATGLGNKVVLRGLVRPAVICGMILLAVSTLGLVLVGESTPLAVTAALLCGRGMALGLTVQPLFTTLLGDLDPQRAADANTLVNGVERMAGSFGVALMATFYQVRVHATGSGVSALHESVILLTVVAIAGALTARLLTPGRPAGTT
jgi:EmrB/QacA subfamily drug resistance transporter